jgi:hypothetical protein
MSDCLRRPRWERTFASWSETDFVDAVASCPMLANARAQLERPRFPGMEDMRAKLEKLLIELENCDLIRNMATDIHKRELFERLAVGWHATFKL